VTGAIAPAAAAAYLSRKLEPDRNRFAMFSRLVRRRRKASRVWQPALRYTNGGVIVALMTFGR
jgi:hypothetical protein